MARNGLAWHLALALANSEACFAPSQVMPADIAAEARMCKENVVARARLAHREALGFEPGATGRENFLRMASELMVRARDFQRAEQAVMLWT